VNERQGFARMAHAPAAGVTADRNARALDAVLGVLDAEGADHALFGGLVATCHGRPRPAADVDILVSQEVMEAVGRSLEARGWGLRRFRHLTKIYEPAGGEAAADLLVWQTNRVLAAAFAGRTPAVVLGRPVKVVPCGAFVALKFEAAVTTARRLSDRASDVRDVAGVLARGFSAEEEARALEIAGVMYRGAVTDLAAFLADLRAGRFPEIAWRISRRSRLLLARGLARGPAR
jgi:hypothetical protein